MKTTSIIAIALAALATTAVPQEPVTTPTPAPVAPEVGPAAPAAATTPVAALPGTTARDVIAAWHSGAVTLGGQATDVTGDSSKFNEYRSVPEGLLAPAFHLGG